MEDEFVCDPYVISKNMGELDDGERQEYTLGVMSMCAGATGKKKGAKRKPKESQQLAIIKLFEDEKCEIFSKENTIV